MNPELMARLAPALLRHLADPALRSIVLACLVGLALQVFRVRNVHVRLAVWSGVLYAALAMPLLGWWLPAIPLRLPVKAAVKLLPQTAPAVAGHASIPSETARQAVVASAGHSFDPLAGETVPRMLRRRRDGSVRWRVLGPALTTGAYLAGLVFLLGRLGAGVILSCRLRRRSSSVEDPGARRWLEWHALAMRVNRAPALAESAALSVPLTLGVWRPVILVPNDWRHWGSAKLSAVIAHELSHVKRKDALTRNLALIYESVFWFSPLGWCLERRLAALGEQASDEAAVRAGAEPTYYAEVLMSFFAALQTGRGRVRLQGVSMARGGRAQDRIERVLSPGVRSSGRVKGSLRALLAFCAAPVVGLTAAGRPMLVSRALAAPASWSIEQAAEPQLPPPPAPAPPSAAPAPAPVPSPAVAGAGARPGPRPAPPAPPAEPAEAPSAPSGPTPAPDVVAAPPAEPEPYDQVEPAPAAESSSVIARNKLEARHQLEMKQSAEEAQAQTAQAQAVQAQSQAAAAQAQAQADSQAKVEAQAAQRQAQQQAEQAKADAAQAQSQAEAAHHDQDNWTVSDAGQGMDFAIVSGKSVTGSGSSDDREQVELLKKKIPGDFIWFIHNGASYVIRDAATVKAAQRLYGQQEGLGRAQEELGKQQALLGQRMDALDKQMDALDKRMEAVRVQVPGDLTERLKKVESMLQELGTTAKQQDLGRLQSELGEMEAEIGRLQGRTSAQQGEIGRLQGELGAQQGALGARQGELGRRQGELGREQERLARQAAREMQRILREALASGSAQRAPQ